MTRFRTDPHFNHRLNQKRWENAPVYANKHTLFERLARKLECSACGAAEDQPCVSTSKKEPGKVLQGVHRERLSAAQEKHGRTP